MVWIATATGLPVKGSRMRRLISLVFLIVTAPVSALAATCFDEAVIYRQDADEATGWNQVLPVAQEDAAIADFTEWPFLDLTINGETTRYSTTSGGTGIRTRTAYAPGDKTAKSFGYTMFDLGGRVSEGEPGHFMILDGELYWPECQ